MADEPRSDAARLSSLSMEESRGLVTLRAARKTRRYSSSRVESREP